MNKRTYLRKLRKALKGVSEQEKDKIAEYYSEMIEEAYDRGKTTEEVFAGLETPEQAARNYLNANDADGGNYADNTDFTEEKPNKRVSVKPRKGMNPLLAILMIPVWIVAVVLALALFIVGASLVIAFSACVLGFFVGGLYAIVMSFGLIISHGAIAATQIGAGLILLGLSLVFALLVKPIAKLFGKFADWVFHGFRRTERERVATSHGKRIVVTVAVALALIVAGSAAGVVGFGKLDWQWHNLAVAEDRIERTETVSLAELSEFTVKADNLALTIVPTTENDAKLVYSDFSDYAKEFTYENGVVSLRSYRSSGSGASMFFGELKTVWEHGLLFRAVEGFSSATLYVPENYDGAFNAKINNGTLNIFGFTLGDVTLETDNGAIAVKECSFGSLDVETDNGAVLIENVVSQSVKVETDNGAIKLNRIEGSDMSFKVSNGAISGSIVGSENEFSITASTGVGSCNLKNSTQGSKSLKVRTGCGAIKISFTV